MAKAALALMLARLSTFFGFSGPWVRRMCWAGTCGDSSIRQGRLLIVLCWFVFPVSVVQPLLLLECEEMAPPSWLDLVEFDKRKRSRRLLLGMEDFWACFSDLGSRLHLGVAVRG